MKTNDKAKRFWTYAQQLSYGIVPAPVVMAAGSGLDGWVPTSPNFGPLAPFKGTFRTVVGILLAVMVLLGLIGAIIGLLGMATSGNNRDKTAANAGRTKVGFIVMFAGFALGGLILVMGAIAKTVGSA